MLEYKTKAKQTFKSASYSASLISPHTSGVPTSAAPLPPSRDINSVPHWASWHQKEKQKIDLPYLLPLLFASLILGEGRSSNTVATWCEESTHRKRHWCWERLSRRGWQRMKSLHGITDSMDMSLSKFQGTLEDMEAWQAAIHGGHKRVRHEGVHEQQRLSLPIETYWSGEEDLVRFLWHQFAVEAHLTTDHTDTTWSQHLREAACFCQKWNRDQFFAQPHSQCPSKGTETPPASAGWRWKVSCLLTLSALRMTVRASLDSVRQVWVEGSTSSSASLKPWGKGQLFCECLSTGYITKNIFFVRLPFSWNVFQKNLYP